MSLTQFHSESINCDQLSTDSYKDALSIFGGFLGLFPLFGPPIQMVINDFVEPYVVDKGLNYKKAYE